MSTTADEEREVERRGGESSKAVWDWLVILGVLLVGVAAGFWFSEQRNAARYQEVATQLAKLKGEDDGTALRTYLDQMSQLLLERNLLGSEEEDEVQKLAQARTLTAIAGSNAEDNRSLTRFLVNMDLVMWTDPVRLLRDSNLPDAQLSGAYLPAADLLGSGLEGADLSEAYLISADLRAARLNDADLRGANLKYANLAHAVLAGADLREADLRKASLEGADLRGADLEGAKIAEEQLDACESLEGATMPDGSKHTQ